MSKDKLTPTQLLEIEKKKNSILESQLTKKIDILRTLLEEKDAEIKRLEQLNFSFALSIDTTTSRGEVMSVLDRIDQWKKELLENRKTILTLKLSEARMREAFEKSTIEGKKFSAIEIADILSTPPPDLGELRKVKEAHGRLQLSIVQLSLNSELKPSAYWLSWLAATMQNILNESDEHLTNLGVK